MFLLIRVPPTRQEHVQLIPNHNVPPQEGPPDSPGGVFDPAGAGSARMAAIALMRHQEKVAAAAADAASAAAAVARDAAKPLLGGPPRSKTSIPGALACVHACMHVGVLPRARAWPFLSG
eukprot:1160701-Pelagomonas_calceolata.AAC.11